METIANRNNNPGNIKDTTTGQFKTYATPQEGYAALLNDLETKKTGKSQTGLKPDQTLADFAKIYAPSSDKNDPAQYTANIANYMGVRPDAKISELDTGKWAEAIANAEGYKGETSYPKSEIKEDLTKTSDKSVTPTYSTPQHSPERIAQYKAEQQGYDQEAKKANSIGGIASDTLKNFGDNLTFGGASTLGDQLGTGFARSTNQVRGLLGGKDNSQYIPEMSLGKTTTGLAGTIGGILATAAPGLKGVLGGPKALGSAEVLSGVKKGAGISAKIFSKASLVEKYNYLHEALQNVGGRLSGSQLKVIQNAINEIEPAVSKLIPGGSKIGAGNALKWGAGKVGGGLLNLAKYGGLVELGRGGQDIKGLLGLDNLTK